MTTSPTPLVAGNWKMNGLAAQLGEVSALIVGLSGKMPGCQVMICPPFTLTERLARATQGSPVSVGAQDCHAKPSGAHTGDISVPMLKDAGAGAVIVGHSERRADHGETDAAVRAKAEAVQQAGLIAIICVGETEAQRDAGKAMDVVGTQLAGSVPDSANASNTVIAYEPVWAIGTGRTPTPADVAAIHGMIREALAKRFKDGTGFRILYGGSVKPDNAAELMSIDNVNGALVGGASLKAADFLGIIAAYRRD